MPKQGKLSENTHFNLINFSKNIAMKKILIVSFLMIVFSSFNSQAQCVNFTQYQPAGWDGSIVVSAITGTNTSESTFYFNQTLYLDIAIVNYGSCNASQTVKANVFLDGVFKTTITYPILNANYYSSLQDFMISGSLGVGTHTIQVDIDSPNLISESNESDNTFTRTFTVQNGSCVSASVNTIFNGNRSINTEHFPVTQFRLRDQCQTSVIQVRDYNYNNTNTVAEITSGNNSWTTDVQRFGGTVMWAAKTAHNYFNQVHDRSGWNGNNRFLDCFVNAVFWNGSSYYTNNASMDATGQMLIGLGTSGTLESSNSTLDIVGHEFTHGVTFSSARLYYQNESGALNESFSDIFAESIENYTLGSNDWLIGQDRTSGASRSMSNPNASPGNDPDTYLGTNWITDPNVDYGGVHTNSGVQNYWFYLLTQGGSGTNDNGNAFNVTGIGISKARAIAFRTLTINLYNQPNANYAMARTASIQSAEELYGINSTEANAVKNAWCAVGIGTAPTAVTVSGGGNVCNSTTVSASGGAGGVIYWQGTNSNGTSTATPATSMSITSSGTYYFRASNGCGWSTVGSVTVNIVSSPAAVSVSGSGTFCNATTITASGGVGGTIYFQGTIPNGAFFGSTSLSQVPTSSGTYYFRSYNATCGWGSQGSAVVTIQNTPAVVTVSGGGTVCNSTTITASGGAGGTIYFQGSTSNGTSFGSTSLSQVATNSGTYYFRSYNATCGWGAEGSTTVTINTIPATTNVSGGGNFCDNTTILASGGNGGTIYWQGMTSGGTSTAISSTSQFVNTSGTYYFRANNACGWGTEGSVTIAIVSAPSVSVYGGGTFCNSAILSAFSGNGGTIYYQGTTSGGTSTAVPIVSQITVGLSGTHYFRGLNGCGWGPEGSVTVIISPSIINLAGTATSGIQKAGQTLSSTQIIPSGTNVNYQAGNSISLQGTFTAENGSVFKAEIKNCSN
jgi:Zn-dependent metalloprotease